MGGMKTAGGVERCSSRGLVGRLEQSKGVSLVPESRVVLASLRTSFHSMFSPEVPHGHGQDLDGCGGGLKEDGCPHQSCPSELTA